MQVLTGNNIYLRGLEPEDLDFLYTVENDVNFWEVSSTQTPYTKHVLQQYLANAHLDIYEAKQLRLIIAENESHKYLGIIDIFDYNPQHKRAGLGILILENEQHKGYASEALNILTDYCFNQLNLHQLFVNISTDNKNSIKLFKKHDFVKIGLKKEWIYYKGAFKDEILFQLLKP